MTFLEAVLIILTLEGGHATNPLDSPTNYGISSKHHPTVDIFSLTKKQAIKIYKEKYWKPCQVERVPEAIRLSYFDSCINIGVYGTMRLFSKMLGVGTDTMFAVAAKKNERELVDSFYRKRLSYYRRLPGWDVFSKSWKYRLAVTTVNSRV